MAQKQNLTSEIQALQNHLKTSEEKISMLLAENERHVLFIYFSDKKQNRLNEC